MNNKKNIIYFIIIISIIAFIIKLFYIQVADSSYKLSAENNAFRRVTQFPARGMIFDRNGKLLVFNQASYDLRCVPNTLGSFDTVAFCKLLRIEKKTLIKQLNEGKKNKYLPLVILKQISKEDYSHLQESLYKFPGFYVESRTLRNYPSSIAAHLLGYVGEVDKSDILENPYYKSGDYIGISGIEKTYEEYLRGTKGIKILIVDVNNQEKGSYKNGLYDTAAIVGKNIMTTLDADIQEYGERLMINKIGSIVAIEPSSGEILALISSPGYDPNLLVGQKRSSTYNELLNNPLKPLFNRALKALYPPGSTFKPVSALIAMQEGLITNKTVYNFPGGYNAGSHTVKDHLSGAVEFYKSIASSSNAYYCYVFKEILTDKKYETVEQRYENWKNHLATFGLGVVLGTDLAYEKKGLIYPASYFDKIYGVGKWTHNTVISLAIGQGELGFTPLQIANMTAAIANQGYYITPHIVKEITNEKINPSLLQKHYTRIDKKYFPDVIDAMEMVLISGTARIAFLDKIAICGKTGTAQNPHGEDHSIFIAFAPKENPKIAIAVYIENAGFGSTWAAPIASLMIEKYLTDSISRPWLEERMFNGNLLNVIKKPDKH